MSVSTVSSLQKEGESWIEENNVKFGAVVDRGVPGSQVTLLEKLDLLPALISILARTLYTSLKAPFPGKTGADTYSRHLLHYFIRVGIIRYSTAQLQYISPSFTKVYKKHCKRRKITPHVVTLSNGLQGFWLGDPHNTKYSLVYFHGGGFALDGDGYHLAYLSRLQATVGSSSLSIFVVAYALTPHASYPCQVAEALSALNYVLLSKPPSSVLIGGDSAGGNLCLALISHALHPHPELEPLNLPERLRGLMLLSPWVSFDTRTKSNGEGENRDIVTWQIADVWSAAYLGLRPSDLYTEPAKAELTWWEDAPVEETIVLAGGSECFRDAIIVWMGKWKAGNPNTAFVLAKNEVHDAPIYDSNLPGYREMETERAAKEWLKSRVHWGEDVFRDVPGRVRFF